MHCARQNTATPDKPQTAGCPFAVQRFWNQQVTANPVFREPRKRIGIAGDKITDGNAVIDKHGKVSQLTLLKGLDPSIDQAVIAHGEAVALHAGNQSSVPVAREQEFHFHYERG